MLYSTDSSSQFIQAQLVKTTYKPSALRYAVVLTGRKSASRATRGLIGADRGPNRAKKGYPTNYKKPIKNQQKVAQNSPPNPPKGSLCYAILLAGRKSAFRAGFWPDCYRERTETPNSYYTWVFNTWRARPGF